MKFDKENDITNKKILRDLLSLKDLSQYFYQKSNGLVACFLTTVFASYLILVMMGQAEEFEVIDSNIKSLGTSFGFEEADIRAFLSERSDEMIDAYIQFNQVWDMLFGLIYGVMYVVWVSVLFKPLSNKVGRLNLLPFVQVLFDWLENYELALLSNQYLIDGMISSSNAKLASIFSITKWACSGLTYTLIFIGIVLLIARTRKPLKAD